MHGWRFTFGSGRGTLEILAACAAGWVAATAERAELDFIRQALAILFNF